jgi:hypothetical protein
MPKKFEVAIRVFIVVEAADEESASKIAQEILDTWQCCENDARCVSYATDDISVLPMEED